MYIIGKEVFKTKKAAEEKIRKVLHSYKHDEFLEVEESKKNLLQTEGLRLLCLHCFR